MLFRLCVLVNVIRLETDNPAPSGGRSKYVKYVSSVWLPVEAALPIIDLRFLEKKYLCWKNAFSRLGDRVPLTDIIVLVYMICIIQFAPQRGQSTSMLPLRKETGEYCTGK